MVGCSGDNEGMNPFAYAYSLRLRHPSCDPSEISRALERTPRFSWKAGEPRKTPDGKALDGVNPCTYWCSEQAHGDDGELVRALSLDLDWLEKHRDFLIQFSGSGGSVEYFVGWYTPAKNSGEMFHWSLLKRFSDLRIDLALDVYG